MKIRKILVAALAAVGLAASTAGGATAAVPAPTTGSLQQYTISSTYVSGLSSGGFMANQMHVAYSDVFTGAGIFSAGPYDCAQNNLNTALYACMDTFQARKSPAQLEQLTRDRAAAGKVDPVANLSGDKVWLFHGTNDSTVKAPVNDDLATYYRDFGADVVYDNTSASGHAWVSPLGPNACTSTSSPYVNNCGGDPVKDMLAHLFGSVKPASSTALTGKLVRFDQSAYTPGGSPGAISMGDEGFAYVPQSCQSGASCKLMVTLHGCYQYFGLVGNALMDKAYLNEYADTNDMIVLYPQATTMSGNPRGCWDWWGYKSADYAQKSGPQMTAVMNMAKALGAAGTTSPPSPLPAPSGLTVTATTNTTASLTWSAVPGAASYHVYRDGTKVNGAPVTATAFTDSGLTAGTTYRYTVAAVDPSGAVGTRSGAVNATTTGTAAVCVTASNYAHTQAGRAHQSGGYAYANGSGQSLGLWSVGISSTIKETSPGYWVKC
ncbi:MULTISPECIES: extracellular catalytic domain type 2 short-chain-length polyhydroxyalkanoate depolymerase [Streptomyces]|uniref:PHB depolymerase family esterase n=2 Tax=Streptomyces TaxID=1883 RepID=A0ABU4KHV7_9ACTN|nr:PHB depolymerase family esterase [Streptomyces roseolus]MDX2297380.1 PHB depolymerase family esterase [Streptomyces roseolus]